MTVLADALEFVGVPERIIEPSRERFITVRLNGGGAVERQIGSGKTPVPFTGYRVRSGQFIYSRIDARNGAFALVPPPLDGAVVSKDFPVFEIRRDRASPDYLNHFFRSGRLQRLIKARSRGATNRQRIKEDEFLAFEIDLPPLDEQRRIAAILDHADTLRAKRRQVLAHLDDLTQSIFYDMFGASEGRRVPIGEFAEVRTGSTPSRDDSENYGGHIPWVKTGEVRGIITRTSEYVTEKAVASARLRLFPAGSVVIAMYGQGKTRGQSAILGVDATTNQACAVVMPHERFDPIFLQAQLALSYDRLRGTAEGGNQPNLSVSRVQQFDIVLPAIVEQRAFATRVEQVNAQRAVVRRALRADDELFASLQARAFRGEL